MYGHCASAAVATLTIDLQKVILCAANKHVERPHLHLKTETSVLISHATSLQQQRGGCVVTIDPP
jgi:hypothetical protein